MSIHKKCKALIKKIKSTIGNPMIAIGFLLVFISFNEVFQSCLPISAFGNECAAIDIPSQIDGI